jgi:RNA polymerase sigma-70 factor (ECF subfamily)
VLEAIRGLPDIYRESFILRHVEDWSYAQIAEAMSLPVDTVETRLVRARRLLRTALRDLMPEPSRSPLVRETAK